MPEQKRLENREIYHIGGAELPLRFTHCVPLLGWRYLPLVIGITAFAIGILACIFWGWNLQFQDLNMTSYKYFFKAKDVRKPPQSHPIFRPSI